MTTEKKLMLDEARKNVEEAKADIPFELIPANKIKTPNPQLRDQLEIDGYLYKVTKAYSRNRYSIKLQGKVKEKVK